MGWGSDEDHNWVRCMQRRCKSVQLRCKGRRPKCRQALSGKGWGGMMGDTGSAEGCDTRKDCGHPEGSEQRLRSFLNENAAYRNGRCSWMASPCVGFCVRVHLVGAP